MEVVIDGRNCYIMENGKGGPVILLGVSSERINSVENIFSILKSALSGTPWTIMAFTSDDWNSDFSPWAAPAVFGTESFPGNGSTTLKWLEESALPWLEINISHEYRYIAGYSLAGLFSLWSMYEKGLFDGAVCCSGSLWFPGWIEYVESQNVPEGSCIYLSLGEKEEHTRNKVMATVGDSTRKQFEILNADKNVKNCTLRWHSGGHFSEVDYRVAEGLKWILGQKMNSLRQVFTEDYYNIDIKNKSKSK